jgi:hypothetical protein
LDGLDAYVQELIALGVLNNGVRTNYVRELLEMIAENPTGFWDTIQRLGDKADTRVGEAIKSGRDLSKKTVETLAKLAEASETYVNLMVYNHFRSVLTEANYGTEQQIKKEAARRSKALAPSRTEAPQAVTAFSRSGFGALLSPFIRFKADMWRITVNNYKFALADMKSDNPVLRRNGKRQLASAVGVHGLLVAAIPYIFQMMAGISDDEDKAIRRGMPEYMRDALLIYVPGSNREQVTFVNVTYLVPHAFVSSPFLNTFKAINRGDTEEVVNVGVRYMTEEMFGENIVAGRMLDVMRNIDSNSRREITHGTDNFAERTYKKSMHIVGGAYNPMAFRRVGQLYDSLLTAGSPAQSQSWLYQPLGILAQTFAPVKLSDYNVADLEYRAFAELARTNRTLGALTSQLQTRGNLTSNEVNRIVNNRVEAQRRVWQEVKDTISAFENLGDKSRLNVEKQAINAGLSRRRVEQIRAGRVDTPILNDDAMKNMLKFGGPERRLAYLEAMRKHGAFLRLD